MRQSRFLAATAAVTLASGVAVVEAPAVFAASGAVTAGQGTQVQSSPVTVALGGVPGTVTAGGAPVEFTATLRNTADHQLDVPSSVFVIGDTGTGIKQSQFKLEYQSPGGTQWQDAKVTAASTGGLWQLDRPNVLHLVAGTEAVYRLRLTVAADAPAGRVAPGFDAVVSDPALPPEQRVSQAMSGYSDLVVTSSATPTAPAPTPAATAEVRLDGMPTTFTAGGEAKPFKLVLTGNRAKDLRVLPAIVFQGATELPSENVKFEFRTADGGWLEGTPGSNSEHPGWLYFGLRTGDKNADVLALPKGGSRTIEVRLSFTRDTPATAQTLAALVGSMPGEGESGSEASSPKADFTITAAAGSTPTPPPTFSAAPVPTASLPSTGPVVPVAEVTSAAPSPAAVGPQAVTAAAPAPEPRLASTGGTTAQPMAITGAVAIALGVGTLVVARRRRRI
ncbi:LPXTG cell wall anchor domain-containing protein [Kitasatospora sp. NPDC086791]|uniref:LPXTG cell wall anchor domain-containing protein n=1 Tax=Kitasatospora sp. NPDC086791 TaxID=3155178 RepID=UPI00341C0516